MSKVYPYPAVQYIPLSLDILFRKEHLPIGTFFLIDHEILSKKHLLFANWEIQLPDVKLNNNKLLVLAGGIEPIEAKYRGYYVIIKASRRPALYLFSIPKNYFYKDTLVFQAKNENGEILVSKMYQLVDSQKAKIHPQYSCHSFERQVTSIESFLK